MWNSVVQNANILFWQNAVTASTNKAQTSIFLCFALNFFDENTLPCPSVLKVWEHGAAPTPPRHWQLLSDPPSQPEVSHRCRDIHGRAAEEAGHRWHGEKPAQHDTHRQAACYCSLSAVRALSTECSKHAPMMSMCHCIYTVTQCL